MSTRPGKSEPTGPLSGQIMVPGDKSISHRALILGANAVGETFIEGLLESEDVLCSAKAIELLGAKVLRPEIKGEPWRIFGRGVGGLSEPPSILDMGNSGTAVRLFIGLTAAYSFNTIYTGDESLSRRPMKRVMDPLRQMGAEFESRSEGRLPLTVIGTDQLIPIEYTLPIASAQIKSAILLAGLNTMGITTVVEPQPTRDHLERMLRYFGAKVVANDVADGRRSVSLTGQVELVGRRIKVPGDVSSAAFPIVACLIVPGSEIMIARVGINPFRIGLIETLKEMGATINLDNEKLEAGEPVADIYVKASVLKGVNIPADRAPSMIDEYPILAIAATCAQGQTRMNGLAELRHKESDRLSAIVEGLKACGVGIEEGEDWLVVHGTAGKDAKPRGGAKVGVNLDHRIAMSFLVLGMVAKHSIFVDDVTPIATSFPGFASVMNSIGASLSYE